MLKAIDRSRNLGLNFNGQEVFESRSGERFLKSHLDTNVYLFQKHGFQGNEFLQFEDDAFSAKNAALGLLAELESGKIVDQDRLDQLIEIGMDRIGVTSKESASFQNRVCIRMASALLADHYNAYNKADVGLQSLQDLEAAMSAIPKTIRAKKHGIQTDNFLPPSYSYLSRKVLETIDNVDQLTVVNQSALGMISMTPKQIPLKLVGKFDDEFVEDLNDVCGHISKTHLDFTEQSRVRGGQIVAHFTKSKLTEKASVDGVSINRLDHLQALNLLTGMDETATAMIIVGADDGFNLGHVDFETESFHSHVFRHFNVVDAVDFSNSLHGSNNPEDSNRAYFIAGKRIVPSQASAPTELNTLYSVREVYQYAESITQKFHDDLHKTVVKHNGIAASQSVSELLSNYTINQQEAAKYEMNFAQAPYTPLTQLVPAKSSAQPINFVFSSREASIKLVRDVGNPDKFLLNELGLTQEHVSRCWDAEQIDALTLGIWRLKNNKPFLQGDATGKGKGRVLAGLLYWQVKHGRKAVFLTSSGDLISDIWRDIRDTELDTYFDPLFIIGDSVKDKRNGEVQFSHAEISKKLSQYLDPENQRTAIQENLVLSTYSQINSLDPKKRTRNNSISNRLNHRADWLLQFAKANQPGFVIDESHNVNNVTSNQGQILKLIVGATDKPVTRSSATWSKDSKSIASCSDMFPKEYTPELLSRMVSNGGTGVQEILASTLTAEGAMVRREHDFGSRRVDIIESEDVQRNRIATDALSEVMKVTREYTLAQYDVYLNHLRAQGNDTHKNIEETSFASTFHLIADAFTNAMRADEIVRQVINDYENDFKTIIGVDKTAGTALEYLFNSLKEEYGTDVRRSKKEKFELSSFPSISLLLKRWVENEGVRKIRKSVPPTAAEMAQAQAQGKSPRAKKVTFEYSWKDELDPSSSAYSKLAELERKALSSIEAIPFLPLSPMDYIKTEAEREGISMAEVSGRKLHIRLNGTSGYILEPFKAMNKADAQLAFNSNASDAIILSRSGTEGISLHADQSFSSYGEEALFPRNILLAGNFLYIVDEEQFFGRGERKGQVVPARSSKVTTGMPLETRLLALSERNRLKLSSSTTGNSKSLRATNSVPNILNSFGDAVVAEYLFDHQEVMDLLGFEDHRKQSIIEIGEGAVSANSIRSLTNAVLGRMMLLSYEEQQSLLEDIALYYNNKLSILQQKGIDPLNTRTVQGNCQVMSETVMFGTVRNHYDSEFEKPVIGQIIKVTSPPLNVSKELLETEIANGLARLNLQSQNGKFDEFSVRLMTESNKIFDRELIRHNAKANHFGGTTYQSVKDAQKSDKTNRVKTAFENQKRILQVMRHLQVGGVYDRDSKFGDSIVVTGVRLPNKPEDLLNCNSYGIQTYSTTRGPITMGIESFFYCFDESEEVLVASLQGEYSNDHVVNKDFELLSIGGITEYHDVLTGNMIEASRLNAQKKFGSQVMLKDSTGTLVPAIMLNRDNSLASLKNMSFNVGELAKRTFVDYVGRQLASNEMYVFQHETETKDKDNKTGSIIVTHTEQADQLVITMPKTKAGRMGLSKVDAFNGIPHTTGRVDKRSNLPRNYIFSNQHLEKVLDVLEHHGFHIQIAPSRVEAMNTQIENLNSSQNSKIPPGFDKADSAAKGLFEDLDGIELNIVEPDETPLEVDERLNTATAEADEVLEKQSPSKEEVSDESANSVLDDLFSTDTDDSELDAMFTAR
ncbi:strawberry notch-like NTP hydrolase domain-containing protein [Vibrio nigripulchritudo]|uniref:strawberry notch-like NTP hydrolase domain-containing protein n=1 Tax=Vibrio nigripulchritudo TaxID=28173 RepID=UPI00190D30D1|nr:strawberry notch family protein [Vibrio nigripulchritudo]